MTEQEEVECRAAARRYAEWAAAVTPEDRVRLKDMLGLNLDQYELFRFRPEPWKWHFATNDHGIPVIYVPAGNGEILAVAPIP